MYVDLYLPLESSKFDFNEIEGGGMYVYIALLPLTRPSFNFSSVTVFKRKADVRKKKFKKNLFMKLKSPTKK